MNNSVVANAFNDETKNRYLQAENLEQQAEILLEQNPYLLIQKVLRCHVCDSIENEIFLSNSIQNRLVIV